MPRDDGDCERNNVPIPPFGPSPTWLHDLKRFVPLQLAFEEEVKEKTDVIDHYETQVYLCLFYGYVTYSGIKHCRNLVQ